MELSITPATSGAELGTKDKKMTFWMLLTLHDHLHLLKIMK